MIASKVSLKTLFHPLYLYGLYECAYVSDRPSVAGLVLKTALSLPVYLTHSLPQNLQNTFAPKPQELGTLNFDNKSISVIM